MVKSCEYTLIFRLLSNARHNVVLIAHRQTEKRTDWLIHFYLNMVISFSYKTCLPESRIETEVNTNLDEDMITSVAIEI